MLENQRWRHIRVWRPMGIAQPHMGRIRPAAAPPLQRTPLTRTIDGTILTANLNSRTISEAARVSDEIFPDTQKKCGRAETQPLDARCATGHPTWTNSWWATALVTGLPRVPMSLQSKWKTYALIGVTGNPSPTEMLVQNGLRIRLLTLCCVVLQSPC